MTKILKDRGFVLKKKKYRETSKLVTIFSENAGKINLIAKGVRTQKSKTSAVLDPINFIEFVYYNKPTRELQYISSADFLDDFSKIKSDFEKIKIVYVIIELTNVFTHEGQANYELFNLVYNSLKRIDESLVSSYQVLNSFLIELCNISGYPVFSGECPLCNNQLDLKNKNFYFTKSYGIVCKSCGNGQNSIINLDDETKNALILFLSGNSELLDTLNSEKLKHLYLPILEFLKFHVDEIKKIKSLELF